MRRTSVLFAVLAVSSCIAFAQEEAPISPGREHAKPRVFISESHSWETSGGAAGVNGTWGSSGSGGARPQTAEIVKTFNQRCPNIQINNMALKSDYVVVLDHEGGKAWFNRDNKVAVYERVSGDSIMSKSTRSLGNSVQEACARILQHWPANYRRMTETSEPEVPTLAARRPIMTSNTIRRFSMSPRLNVESTPAGADIEVDGSFMGNTPSSLELSAGEHDIVVRKAGYKPWTRHLKLSGGDVRLAAELEK